MNIAVILAGGTGERYQADKPKQFTDILGKPMIYYSLKLYQESPLIDAIEVVCLESYIKLVQEIAQKFKISKLKWICPGGQSCQESTKNGIFNLEGIAKNNDYLSFNMSSSLFVSNSILEDSFRVARKNGNAFACMPCVYNNAESTNNEYSEKINFKEKNRTLNMPWTASYDLLLKLYKYAWKNNIETHETSYMPTLFLALGQKLYFSKDDSLNKIHIQKPSDKIIAEAIISYKIDENTRER